MQAHISDTTNIDLFIDAMRAYSEKIGEVNITELDVAQNSAGINADYYQAVFYKTLFESLIKEVENGVNLTSVTICGLTDDNSWKKESSPLLFNGDLSKKMAFDAVVYAITGKDLPEPAYVAPDFSDSFYDFETSSDGITARGDGKIEIQSEEVFDGKSALKNSKRTSSWNGASFDVSRFVGQTIDISAWVKSASADIKLSADIDGSWPVIATADTSSGEWVQIKGRYSVPKDLTALKLYFEASDFSDIYIDDLKVKLVGLDEGFEGSSNIALARGVGHMPVITVTDSDSKSGGRSLKVSREASEATVKMDVSPYIGRNIRISAYVKTSDSTVKMGLETGTPVELCSKASDKGGWTLLQADCLTPDSLNSAMIYIETNGSQDFYVDDFSVRLLDYYDNLENGASFFDTRWVGAGRLEYVKEASGNHAVKLTDKSESYYGVSFDASEFLGNEVEITCDVKTDDSEIYLTGDLAGEWPRYITAKAKPGQYATIGTVVRLPKDLTSLSLYVSSNGTSDIFVDNLSIKRVKIDDEYKVTFDDSPKISEALSGVFTKGYLINAPAIGFENTFLGWYKERSLMNEWNFNADKLTEECTLYAKFEGNKSDDNKNKNNDDTSHSEVTKQPADEYATEGSNAVFGVSAKGEVVKTVNKTDEDIVSKTKNGTIEQPKDMDKDKYKRFSDTADDAERGTDADDNKSAKDKTLAEILAAGAAALIAVIGGFRLL